MGEGQWTNGVRIPRKGDHADKIIGPAGEILLSTNYKFLEYPFYHLQTVHLPATIFQFCPHAAGAVNDHLNGNTFADLPDLLPACLRPGQRYDQEGKGDNPYETGLTRL